MRDQPQAPSNAAVPTRKRLRLYRHLDSRFDDSDEGPARHRDRKSVV